MTTPVISTLAQLEAALKIDLFTDAGTPVLTFLSSMQTIGETLAANAEPSAAEIATAEAQTVAAWVTLQAGIIGSVPNLAAEAVIALAAFGSSQVQAFLTPPASAPVAK